MSAIALLDRPKIIEFINLALYQKHFQQQIIGIALTAHVTLTICSCLQKTAKSPPSSLNGRYIAPLRPLVLFMPWKSLEIQLLTTVFFSRTA
jgi:hypothetical protein